MNQAIVIIGGMMSWPQRYEEMRRSIADLSGDDESAIPISPLYPTDWAKLLHLGGWKSLLVKVDQVVRDQSQKSGERVLVIGHSLGGVIGRLITEYDQLHGIRYQASGSIAGVVGLGSPFNSHRVRKILKLAALLETGCPNGRRAPCLAVAGRAVHGDMNGSLQERYAYQAYKWHIRRGSVPGDLMIPEPAVLVEGVSPLRLAGVYHEKFVSPEWFGAPNVVQRWWTAATGLLGADNSNSAL